MGDRLNDLAGLAEACRVMWDLAMERMGRGDPVPYERCVRASTGAPPSPFRPEERRERVAALLARAGHPSRSVGELLESVDAWRAERQVPMGSVRLLGAAAIARFDRPAEERLVPHLPLEVRAVPRANIEFLPIRDAWFRAR